MLTCFSITQQGEGHKNEDFPCQDYSLSKKIYVEHLDEILIVSYISDGVGSCPLSHIGSETAVKSAVDYIEKRVNSPEFIKTDSVIEEIICESFRCALEHVHIKADEMGISSINYESTLTGVIYDGNNLWFGHIGDDGIVALYKDATYKMITMRHKGEFINSVYPLRCEDYWEFGKEENVVGAVLMTDGVLDCCVDTELMENRVYFPLLEPALTVEMSTEESVMNQKLLWEEFFTGSEKYQDNFRKYVTDDITFAVIQNSEEIIKLGEVAFDFEKWIAGNEEKEKKIRERDAKLAESAIVRLEERNDG